MSRVQGIEAFAGYRSKIPESPVYEAQSADLDAQLQIEEAALVEELTHQELAQNPL